MSSERINNAAVATAMAERAIESAQNLLKRDRPCNAFGVYMDPKATVSDLAAVSREIVAAARALAGIEWPEKADYEAV